MSRRCCSALRNSSGGDAGARGRALCRRVLVRRSLLKKILPAGYIMSSIRMRDKLVFAFPAAMATLQEPVVSFLRAVFQPNPYEERLLLRGVYFTSSVQQGAPIDRLADRIDTAFGVMAPPPATMQPFWVVLCLVTLAQRQLVAPGGAQHLLPRGARSDPAAGRVPDQGLLRRLRRGVRPPPGRSERMPAWTRRAQSAGRCCIGKCRSFLIGPNTSVIADG